MNAREVEVKTRLDQALTARGLVASRSQAESYIKLGLVVVNSRVIKKPGYYVGQDDVLKVVGDQYVSRAALKLASIAKQFQLDFDSKTVLDVGSSTGGFTDYALQHGTKKVLAVDVGTDQLHPSLRGDERIELHEKTDIRDFTTNEKIDLVVTDVSFISLTKILPYISKLITHSSELVIMCKPQFEAEKSDINKGVVKNSKIRRDILKKFELWLHKNDFIIKDKADSKVSGSKGNVERFYLLKLA